ncbi:hypothetical protein NQ315_011323 [Exocentrus adspersus]|uniref:Reverse transcriptase domain-containing protein n=1 Tax=Exocentrus adspersus TaxID=1586481 RepID=A0AAV8VJY0_9CUCU|nr:hypothetical protein NQ315_011323 [Exocentrus adspersus]
METEPVGGSSSSREDSGVIIATLSAENNELRKRVAELTCELAAVRQQATEEAQKAASRHQELMQHLAPSRSGCSEKPAPAQPVPRATPAAPQPTSAKSKGQQKRPRPQVTPDQSASDDERAKTRRTGEAEKTASTSKDANKAAPQVLPEAPQAEQPKIPPMVLRKQENWSHVSRLLKDRKANYVKAKMIGDNSIAITPATAADYRLITKVLEADKQEYHTYSLHEERNLRAVIRGIPTGISEKEIKADLVEQGFTVLSVHRMTSRRDMRTMPLVLVQVPTNQGNLLQSRCTAQPKCVKCGADHETGRCKKSREEPARCANCSGPHPASYRGCPKYPKPAKKTAGAKKPAATAGGQTQPPGPSAAAVPESLRVASWNIDSFTARKHELQEFLTRLEIDVVALQETRLAENMSTKIPGYVVLRQDRNRRGGGVAVATKRGIDHYMLQVPQLDTIEAVAVGIRTSRGDIEGKRNTDWANFRAEMQRSAAIPRIETTDDLEAAVVSLEADIRTALERSTTETREVRRAARRRALRSGAPEHRRIANQLSRRVRAALDEHRQETWRRFVESLNPRDNSLWKTQKALKTRRRPVPPLHGEQGIVHTNRDKAEAFADSLELQCRENQLDDEDEEHTALVERRARQIGQTPDDEEIRTVLSPHLFNIYTSDLPRTDRTSMSLYADDTVLAAQSTEAAMASRYRQRTTDELEEWCNRWKVAINADKSTGIIFTRRPTQRRAQEVTINGEAIQWSNNVKYLGGPPRQDDDVGPPRS